MKILKSTFLIALLILTNLSIIAQVKRTSIIEHFTNTSCSICAGNNNSIYSAINSQTGTIHISFHPSSPYTSDFFNQQNKTENDNRTHFYSIYGGTPRVVVNGGVISASNLQSTLTSQASATSNFSIVIKQNKLSVDSFAIRTVIRKVAADTISKALLFIGVAEDTIIKTTNNGETNHFNVFRKALTQITGNTITLPKNIGDSMLFIFKYKVESGWNAERVDAIGIIQKNDKQIINSAKSFNQINKPAAIRGISSKNNVSLVYPNPFNSSFNTAFELYDISIYNYLGKLVYKQAEEVPVQTLIDLSNNPSGIYFIKAKKDNVLVDQRVLKF